MNSRKYICIFLATLLLVSHVGFSFNVHYCGDTVSSISIKTALNSNELDKNCCGVIKKKSHCCKNKVFKIHKKYENTIANTVVFHPNFDFLIQELRPVIFVATVNFKNHKVTSYTCNANAPPVYRKNCQLLFYA